MPELPEVETIKNDLLPHVVGRSFAEVVVASPEVVKAPSPEEFRRGLRGQRIRGLRRRGKYLIFDLHSGDAFIVHLKMTGALLINFCPDGYRAYFRLDHGTELAFTDRRKLGGLWLVPDAEIIVGKLGPEPLEAGFTVQALADMLGQRSAPIKALLLDQSFLAGLGNMYADEALFAARIHPLTPARDLTRARVDKLYGAIRSVLQAGIRSRGASVDTYRTPDGGQGMAHLAFKVAHMKGKPCPACGTPIERLALRGRGAYFCPKCQPPPAEVTKPQARNPKS
ncbi:MAG: bifunctional DNA-formamidopyrimidine glycosylase/DNA-(apurinic or apyrimidinic site) lyase [Chloroflexi bacterium]|nr:bifunctional DNA-formamidopyrimidine glycosylase/DNA-(apurinic or apyrimidinic site) lyase [Chloroflexota bacterium]